MLRLINANIREARIKLGDAKTTGNLTKVRKQKELINRLKKLYKEISVFPNEIS